MTREYCKKCSKCRQRAVVIATVAYELEAAYDDGKYHVVIPALSVPQCTNCGNISLDYEADQQITRAIRERVGVMQPEAIQQERARLGLSQEAIAGLLGVPLSTYEHWETGMMLPMRVQDRLLRAFFAIPELRTFLALQPTQMANGAVKSETPVEQAVA